jgi:hypothetical protein
VLNPYGWYLVYTAAPGQTNKVKITEPAENSAFTGGPGSDRVSGGPGKDAIH